MFLPPAIAAVFTPEQLDAMDAFLARHCSPMHSDTAKLDLAALLVDQQRITLKSMVKLSEKLVSDVPDTK